MEILEMLMKYVDMPSVLLAIGATQFIKWRLPAPAGGGTFDVPPKIYRLLPLFPLIIATIIVIIKDGIFTPIMSFDESIVRGLLSGMASSYLYRTAKVMIFGGDKNGNGKPDEPEEKKTEEVAK